MVEISNHLNAICSAVTQTQTLNALHACRPGHPLNSGDMWAWRNAWAQVQQLPWSQYSAISASDRDWLRGMAEAEISAA